MASLEALKAHACAYLHYGVQDVPARFVVRDRFGGVYGYCCNTHAERMLAEAQAAERHEIKPREVAS